MFVDEIERAITMLLNVQLLPFYDFNLASNWSTNAGRAGDVSLSFFNLEMQDL